jgi:hypothetical protein
VGTPFSAALLSYERREHIAEILEQLVQEPDLDDIVIWDNWPNDELDQLVKPFRLMKDITVVRSNKNTYVGGRFNAIRMARHDVVYTQDDDCIVLDIEQLRTVHRMTGKLACYLDKSHMVMHATEYVHEYNKGVCHEMIIGWGAVLRRSWVDDALDIYRRQHGEDELYNLVADRAFVMLLQQEHVPLEASFQFQKSADEPVPRAKDVKGNVIFQLLQCTSATSMCRFPLHDRTRWEMIDRCIQLLNQ